MKALLFGIIAWASSGLLARVLVGAGLTLVVYSGVSAGVESLLQQAASSMSGMPTAVVQLAMLSGVGQALSILGSALMTRVGLTMAGNIAGLKKI